MHFCSSALILLVGSIEADVETVITVKSSTCINIQRYVLATACASLFSELIEALLVSRREFSGVTMRKLTETPSSVQPKIILLFNQVV